MAWRQAVDTQASSNLRSAVSVADGTAVNFCRETPSHTGISLKGWNMGWNSALIHCLSWVTNLHKQINCWMTHYNTYDSLPGEGIPAQQRSSSQLKLILFGNRCK